MFGSMYCLTFTFSESVKPCLQGRHSHVLLPLNADGGGHLPATRTRRQTWAKLGPRTVRRMEWTKRTMEPTGTPTADRRGVWNV